MSDRTANLSRRANKFKCSRNITDLLPESYVQIMSRQNNSDPRQVNDNLAKVIAKTYPKHDNLAKGIAKTYPKHDNLAKGIAKTYPKQVLVLGTFWLCL